MFEAFSESARRVIFLARYEAGRLKFDHIDLPHLLLGFILEDQGKGELHLRKSFGMEDQPVGESLQQQNDPSFLHGAVATKLQSIFSTFGPRAEPQPVHGDMVLTDATQKALHAAFQQANGSSVSPLHLLWAILADDGPIGQTLMENGVTREQVENEIYRRNAGERLRF